MPLTEKGETIKGAMAEEYGPEKGERVFYASKTKGTITGVDAMSGSVTPLVSSTPAPVTPQGTTTTPPVTGVNSGITPGATATPQTDGMGVRDLAVMAGATPLPAAPQPTRAAGASDAKPGSVRALARMAGAKP